MNHELAIEVHDLSVAYRDQPVLWDVDMQVRRGCLSALVGPNGAGKSTLLKSLMGLIKPAAGTIRLLGSSLDEVRRRISYVPQRGNVDWTFPVTVRDVVLMGRYPHLGWFSRPAARDRRLAMEALDRVGMSAYADRQISQLSGGQQQRAFLARALVQDGDLLLMDEPFQGVDARTEKAIIGLLRELRTSGRTVLVVHHDLQTIPDYFDCVSLLNVRMVAEGLVDEVFTEENLRLCFGGRRGEVSESSTVAVGTEA